MIQMILTMVFTILGEKVTFLNGTVDIYNPKKIHELRSKCVDIQNDYFMQVFFISMLAPEFVSVFFGLKPTTADAIKDIGYSSLKQLTMSFFPTYNCFLTRAY